MDNFKLPVISVHQFSSSPLGLLQSNPNNTCAYHSVAAAFLEKAQADVDPLEIVTLGLDLSVFQVHHHGPSWQVGGPNPRFPVLVT